jgi:Uncharacterised MFS-type transporter YbfB
VRCAEDDAGTHHWIPAIATLTVVVAAGQCVGPVLAGVLSDGSGGLEIGLGLSAAILAVSSVVGLGQRHHEAPVPLSVVQPSSADRMILRSKEAS